MAAATKRLPADGFHLLASWAATHHQTDDLDAPQNASQLER